MTISEAFINYEIEELVLQAKPIKTVRNYRCAVNSLLKTVPDVPIEFLTYQHVTNWKASMMQDGREMSYIASQLSRLRQVLIWLRTQYDVKTIDPAGIRRPSVRQKDPTWLSVDEIRQLLSVIESPRDKAFFAALFGCGARISELISLNRDSIKNGEATIIGKGDKLGVLRFDPNSMAYIGAYLETRRDALRPLFISAHHRRITASRMAQLLHEYADAAGIDKNVTPHVLRHSFATDLKMNGADIYDIKEQLRHEKISSTQIYVHLSDSQKTADYRRFHSAVPLV